MNNLSVENYVRPKLELPNGGKKLLLHSCCAPCAGEIMEAIAASNIETTIYFYNPNIHPEREYMIRKEENKKFALKHKIPFIDADYENKTPYTILLTDNEIMNMATNIYSNIKTYNYSFFI